MIDRFYRSLYRIRRVEEEIARIYPSDKIKSPVHLSIGQEAIAVGVCEALRPDDVVFGTYRSHAYYLAKGGDLKAMLGELYGKATGCAGGRGGSMHLIDVAHGVMGATGVVGTTIPHAVGYAYAMRYQAKDSVVVSFFGDGAVDEGVFHESLNFAALKRLPLVFICENNFYAIHTHRSARQAFPSIHKLAEGYGIPSECIEQCDPVCVYDRVRPAVDRLRSGGPGPYFFECLTYRWKEHVGPNDDFKLGYRTPAEAEPWKQGDALGRLAGMLPDHERRRIEAEVETEIAAAVEKAEQAPFPEPNQIMQHVFKES